MITEAIILAGGLGTRLRPVVSDVPKSLAPVAGKPFLHYVLEHTKKQGVRNFVFALGYRTDMIEQFVKENLSAGSYRFSVEDEPLGTGGAIYKACALIGEENCFVLNADTYFGASLKDLSALHEQRQADCTLALKSMQRFDRYGMVEINSEQIVTGFHEKKFQESGLINGGVYALNKVSFSKKRFPPVFSFEKDYLEKEYPGKKILGLVSDSYFIDIGIPEDYERAQRDFSAPLVNNVTKKI